MQSSNYRNYDIGYQKNDTGYQKKNADNNSEIWKKRLKLSDYVRNIFFLDNVENSECELKVNVENREKK